MKFVVITHVLHKSRNQEIIAYAPYVQEMNLWFKYVDQIEVVAPKLEGEVTPIDLAYSHRDINLKDIPEIQFISLIAVIKSIIRLPIILIKIFIAMKGADHIHLRCPGNIGLLGCLVQLFFPNKQKTAKYAGNWDPNAKQPLSYRFQKWILANTFLTRNIQVLVYGDWPGLSKNIKPFFTATYPQSKVENMKSRNFNTSFHFVFVGSLSTGKRPLYAIKLLAFLLQKGIDCKLDLFGEGVEKFSLEGYIRSNNLTDRIRLYGNQTAERVETAYKKSHFLILPSKSEGWPKVVAEAMFWGTIPIVPEISCVPWMLGEGQRGILMEMDLERDANAIISLLSSQERMLDMSKKAKIWSQNYTLDAFEAEMCKLIDIN